MDNGYTLKTIARIHSDFPTKFGIPRQSGLVEQLLSTIVFEPEYRVPAALRGLEGFSHLWLIWQFSEAVRGSWRPTVRPPRLGGNTRIGVFTTRSPFRPNALGLSCVKLEGITQDAALGPVLTVAGADLMDGTPIFDLKPYLPYTDSRPGAAGGFAQPARAYALEVEFPERWLARVPQPLRAPLTAVLAQDPRPSYQADPDRVYGFFFAGLEVKFTVQQGLLTVCGVVPATPNAPAPQTLL